MSAVPVSPCDVAAGRGARLLEVCVLTRGVSRTLRIPARPAFTIGRAPECGLQLAGHGVSRHHLLLQVRAGALELRDQSRNGTRVAGRRLHHSTASTAFGTPIQIGQHTLVIHPARSERERSPSQPSATELPSPRHVPANAAAVAGLRREMLRRLIDVLDLSALDPVRPEPDPSLRPRVLEALNAIAEELQERIPVGLDRNQLVQQLADEAVGLGPLERVLADPSVNEVMVVGPEAVYVERSGVIQKTTERFTDTQRLRAVIERIVAPLGRRIDEASPLVDARLSDGARVNIVIHPTALHGPYLTIRKFTQAPLTLDQLYAHGSLSPEMGRFLCRAVLARKNILVSGGTSSGKTTLLGVLSATIPEQERIVTIEDAAELRLRQPHVVALETRPANLEGQGELSTRLLVRNAMRMRPDRIVVGECRGGEALDMLCAMNTGHDGSLTTTHANSPAEAVARLETLALMAGLELPARAIREQIASSLHVIVHQQRFTDGTRKVSAIAEVVGMGRDGRVDLRPIFQFVRLGCDKDGKVIGEFRPTGYLPSFLGEFQLADLIQRGEPVL